MDILELLVWALLVPLFAGSVAVIFMKKDYMAVKPFVSCFDGDCLGE